MLYVTSLVLIIPFITIVISPITSLLSKKLITLEILLPICSSNFFVNSRKISISLSPPQNNLLIHLKVFLVYGEIQIK